MKKEMAAAARFALVLTLGVTLAGCGQVGKLKGQMAFKDANVLYQTQKYRDAAAKYEEAVAENPELTDAYFFLGNSYDNQYRATKRGDAENDALLEKAIANYKKRSEMDGGDPKIKRLALEYLVSAYGPEKMNDPAQQEPILLRMIEVDKQDTTAYFGLANIYEQSGDYQRAEEMLNAAREQKPKDPAVYMQLAGFHNRQGAFDKTMEALHARAQMEPNNPEAFYTIASYYWEKAYRDFTLSPADQLKFTLDGLKAVDEAIRLKPDYFEALTYKNLLLRVQARIVKDPAQQQKLLAEAKQYEARATEVRKKQSASSGAE
jgi:tetratricopeptide (TPR) repeat protein